MKKMTKTGLIALTLMLGSTAAFADSFEDLFKNVGDKVTKSVTEGVKKLTGDETEGQKVRKTIEGGAYKGRFATASGTGMDVVLELGENGLYRRVDIYHEHPNDAFVEMGVWEVSPEGKIVLTDTLGENTEFTMNDKKQLLLGDGEPKALENVLTKADADLFDSRDFLVDLDKRITFRSDDLTFTLAGDGTFFAAEPKGAKSRVFNGLWAELSDGLITLKSPDGQLYFTPSKKGFLPSDDQGKPNGGALLTRERDLDLFATFEPVSGVLYLDKDGKEPVFVTEQGFTYAVDPDKTDLKSLAHDENITVQMIVLKAADDDDLPLVQLQK